MSAQRRQAELRQKAAREGARWQLSVSAPRWVRWATGTVIILAFVGWGTRQLLAPTTLPIQQIRLEGNFAHVSPERVRALVAARVHAGFFGVNVEKVQALVQALPWVDTATVRRVWPHTLAIRIQEQKPLARWAAGGLVNVHGKIYRPDAKSYPSGLPVLAGPAVDTVSALTTRYREARAMLAPLGLKVTRLSMDKRHSWRLVMSNHIKLVLGREDSLARLQRFAEVYTKVLAPRATDIARVDLRYTNGFAVAWRHADSNQSAGGRPVGNGPAGTQQG